ncbi:hypothetical protein [Bacillus wiedmannii]|uniref:Bacteriocin biosynthesis protein n=1 Tax=Bacillus wiedmannii TaxID=1890302 RepID=A0A2A8BSQ7_9BACI|nr:hypothetical protein [Bacillus wiedmannii]PEM57653.1 hypothetical protein CN611_07530 [Bacillus wiedmannii]
MEEMYTKMFMNLGVFGVFGFAFFWFLKYYLVQNEKREEGYKEEIKRGAEREMVYIKTIDQNHEIIKENQDIIKSQAKSLETVEEIKSLIKQGS